MNESGFTLIEAVIGLAAFCSIAVFFPLAFTIVLGNTPGDEPIQRMEWSVFSSQLKKEARMANDFQISSGKLHLDTETGEVLYEMYGASLRRRVNGRGHEVVFQNIVEAEFNHSQGGFTVIAKDKKGRVSESYCGLYIAGRVRHEE